MSSEALDGVSASYATTENEKIRKNRMYFINNPLRGDSSNLVIA
jgi:hypothetical protein